MANIKKTNNLIIGNVTLDLVDDEARELIDTLRSDVESDIADIRSDVSDDISVIDARVDNLVTDVNGAETVTLWNGSMSADGGTYTLSQSVSNFDFIDIYYDNQYTGVADYLRIPANKASAAVYIPFFETGESLNKPLEIGKVALTFSGASVTVAAAKQWWWDGTNEDNATVLNAQISFPVRIDGVKSSASVNAELADVRVGADGTTYNTAGAAVRGQISELKSDLNYTNEAAGVYINLWDTSKVVADHYFANGESVANTNFSYIIIPCKAGDTFVFGNNGETATARYMNELTGYGSNLHLKQNLSTITIEDSATKQLAITFNNNYTKPQINRNELLPYVSYGSSIPIEVLSNKVDKDGKNQVKRINLEGVSIGNYFAFAELDREGAFANATSANVYLTYTNSSALNCYFVPVKKNTDYTITFARFLVLLDAGKKSLAPSSQNVTTFNSGNAEMISVTFNPTTYPIDQFKICEVGTDAIEAYIYPDWLHPIKPIPKSDVMTIPVGVDTNGKLFASEQTLAPKKYKSLYAFGDISTGQYIMLDKETALKKGESLMFSCNITTFDKLIVGWSRSTPDQQKYPWCEITNTSIIVHGTNANGPAAPTLTHGLTIAVNLQFKMTIKYDSIDVELMSNGERYTGTVQVYKTNQGYGFAMSDGSTLTDCKLSWCASDIDKTVWMFGDSYFGITNTSRWLYYLQDDGYSDNALIDAYAGRNTVNALVTLNSLITLGKPDYIVWCMGMNDGSDTDANIPSSAWVTGRDAVLAVCDAYGCIPVFATIPNVPNIQHTGKNAWIKSSGFRYIDFAKAVGAESSGSTWYSGMLSSDNVHPTDKGAKALYGQFLADFPEIIITD